MFHTWLICLISYHHKILPVFILKLLMESLVLSYLNYALPVWGPPLTWPMICCQSWLKCGIIVL